MVPLAWSVDPRDWARPGTRSIVRNIMGNTRPGSIILEHDGGGNRAETVAALRIVLAPAAARGLPLPHPVSSELAGPGQCARGGRGECAAPGVPEDGEPPGLARPVA